MLKQIFIISSTLFIQLFDFDWPLAYSGCISSRTYVFFFTNSLDVSGCRDTPVDESNEEVTERLREKIKNGEHTIGKLILPKKIIKTTLCGNRIENVEVEISGRKMDITYIRTKLIDKNEKLMRKRSDEVFDNMARESIIENLQKLNEVQSSGLNLERNY